MIFGFYKKNYLNKNLNVFFLKKAYLQSDMRWKYAKKHKKRLARCLVAKPNPVRKFYFEPFSLQCMRLNGDRTQVYKIIPSMKI